MDMQSAFQIDRTDNVATALCALTLGPVLLRGDSTLPKIQAVQDIPVGHKLALRDIAQDEPIIKYGVIIAVATQPIACGQWVHLHCVRSTYDERSSHLDAVTGAPQDTRYE